MESTPNPSQKIRRKNSLSTAERRQLTLSRIASKKKADEDRVVELQKRAQDLTREARKAALPPPTKEDLLATPEQMQKKRIKSLEEIGKGLSTLPALSSGEKKSTVVVKLNYFVNEVSDIDANSQCFTVDFYLDTMWHDPRLEHLNPEDTHLIEWSKVWNPALEIANARVQRRCLKITSSIKASSRYNRASAQCAVLK